VSSGSVIGEVGEADQQGRVADPGHADLTWRDRRRRPRADLGGAAHPLARPGEQQAAVAPGLAPAVGAVEVGQGRRSFRGW
jgi:hypothetical protein